MRTYRILATLMATLIVAGCDSSSSSTAPDTENNGGGSALAGKILHDNGKPFANLVVRLKSTGATTRTDANGAWSLPIPGATKAFVAHVFAARTLETVDSVVVSTDSQTIAAEPVTDYHATLPDLYIVQRDLYGSLANFVPGKYVVTGYLTLPDGTTRTIPLWHNEVAHAFSGFIYTTYTTNVLNYSVRVVVRDTTTGDTVTTGLSPVVPFNSTAGDVSIPVFSYKNVIPSAKIVLSGTAALGNEVTLNAVVGDTDIVGGYMVVDTVKNKVEWLHNGVVVSNKKSIVVTLGADMFRDSTYTLRVTDDQDSLVATDKFSINLPKGEAVVVKYFTKYSLSLMSARQMSGYTDVGSDTIIDSTYAAILASDTNFTRSNAGVYAYLGDTIDLSSVDRNASRTTYRSCRYDSTAMLKDGAWDTARRIFDAVAFGVVFGSDSARVYGFNCSDKDTATFSKAFNTTYVSNFGLASKGYAYMRLVIWSEKPIVVATATDTFALKAGDNNVAVGLKSYMKGNLNDALVLRTFSHNDYWYGLATSGNLDLHKHAGYPALYADWFFTGKMPASFSGTYAGGLLKADNSDANSGKVVIKSVYGYR